MKREEYYQYVEIIENLVNNSSKEGFLLLKKTTNRIRLLAEKELALIVSNYLDILVDKANKQETITADLHVYYHTKIINAMRKELDSSSTELNNIIIYRT